MMFRTKSSLRGSGASISKGIEGLACHSKRQIIKSLIDEFNVGEKQFCFLNGLYLYIFGVKCT